MLLLVVIKTLSTELKLQYVILISASEIRNKAYSFVPMYLFVIDLIIYDSYLSSHDDRTVYSVQHFEPAINGQETLERHSNTKQINNTGRYLYIKLNLFSIFY